MIVRALDENNDWTFGQSKNNYLRNNFAVAQSIQTRCSSFTGNCFFDTSAGINWLVYLSGKSEIAMNLALSATILNTPNVVGILQLSVNLTPSRSFQIQYQVQTSYSLTNGNFVYSLGGSVS